MNCHRLFCTFAITSVLFLGSFSLRLDAGVSFEFTYFDSPGAGFNDGPLGDARKASLELVAAEIGSMIAQDATVRIGVAPSETDGTGFAASAGADFEGLGPPAAGFYDGEVYAEIVDGISAVGAADCGGMACHGGMVVDFGYSYALSGTPSPTEIHFPGLMLHELTHVLGYGSFIKATGPFAGTGLNGTYPDVYTRFDLLVTEIGDSPLIDAGTFMPVLLDPVAFEAHVALGLKFDGVFAKTAAMSDFFLATSDPTHSSLPGDIMGGAIAFGAETFGWSAVDVGVLLDLGYAVGLDDADFDSNGEIGGIDFLKWQLGFDAFAPLGDALLSDGDADHDGFVTKADFSIWEDQFGTPGAMPPVSFPLPFAGPLSSAIVNVPEPTSLLLLAIGAAFMLRVGRVSRVEDRRGRERHPIF